MPKVPNCEVVKSAPKKPWEMMVTIYSIKYLPVRATQLTNLLNAIGKIKITSALMVMWTLLTWGLVPYLGVRYGVNGASFGYSIVGLSSIVAIVIVKKYVNFSIINSTLKPFLASVVMAVILLILRAFLPYDIQTLGILIVIGLVSYTSSIFALVGQSLLLDVKKVLINFSWKR